MNSTETSMAEGIEWWMRELWDKGPLESVEQRNGINLLTFYKYLSSFCEKNGLKRSKVKSGKGDISAIQVTDYGGSLHGDDETGIILNVFWRYRLHDMLKNLMWVVNKRKKSW